MYYHSELTLTHSNSSKMNQQIHEAMETLELSSDNKLTEKAVTKAFFRLAKLLHPDKHPDDKMKYTLQFQQINSAYQAILEYLNKLPNDTEESNGDGEEGTDDNDETGRFIRENFKKFNFPKQNEDSFTVIIEDHMADKWEEDIEKVYGTPDIVKTPKGVPYAKKWKFSYQFENQESVITLHLYNKPKSKGKQSKILVQGGSQYALFKYVFSELPKIYKCVSASHPLPLKATSTPRQRSSRSSTKVMCTQCKKRLSMPDMRIHIRTFHPKKLNCTPTTKTAPKHVTHEVIESAIVIDENTTLEENTDQPPSPLKIMDDNLTITDIEDEENPLETNKSKSTSLTEPIPDPVQMFPCTQCKCTFNQITHRQSHIKAKHENTKCDDCLLSFEGSDGLNEHICATEEQDPWQCGVCASCFKTEDDCKTHMHTHSPPPAVDLTSSLLVTTAEKVEETPAAASSLLQTSPVVPPPLAAQTIPQPQFPNNPLSQDNQLNLTPFPPPQNTAFSNQLGELSYGKLLQSETPQVRRHNISHLTTPAAGLINIENSLIKISDKR